MKEENKYYKWIIVFVVGAIIMNIYLFITEGLDPKYRNEMFALFKQAIEDGNIYLITVFGVNQFFDTGLFIFIILYVIEHYRNKNNT